MSARQLVRLGSRLSRTAKVLFNRRIHSDEEALHRTVVTDNVAYNREIWQRYAATWDNHAFRIANADAPEDAAIFEAVGDEWGRQKDVDAIVAEYILPFVSSESLVGEIGCGGGRIARRVVDSVRILYCTDISERMLQHCRRFVTSPHAKFVLLNDAELPESWASQLDFIYAFDVFLHLDLYVQWKYVKEICRVLRPGGRAFLHTTNLTSDSGWDNFVKFDHYRVETHFYVSPETVRTLVTRAGLRVIKESRPKRDNFYLSRDFLLVVEKP
jgi:SAM-dependent methyltransferase